MISDTATAKEIAAATTKTVRFINQRALKENWPYSLEKCKGGKRKLFPIATLPEDIRLSYYKWTAEQQLAEGSDKQLPVPAAQPPVPARVNPAPALRKSQTDKALAKYSLLQRYTEALQKAPWGNKKAHRRDFMRAYNAGLSYPALFEKIGKTNWKTIEGWRRKLRRCGNDAFALADTRGAVRRGATVLSAQQTDILLRCVLHPNRPKISEAIRLAWSVMHARGIANGNSESTYRRWLYDWRDTHFHIWTFTRQGAKAWNDKCALYIERDYTLINVGDILVADGHILNFEILNPFTGKPKRMVLILWYDMRSSFPLGWEIMPTENTEWIASALRRAILRLGKYPQVAYLDNGRAFASRFFNGADIDSADFEGVFARLGIKTIFAWPYHGQSKTVERFFGSFAELERWCPTYTGTCIDTKPPRMMRGERLHRRVYDKAFGGRVITIEQAHRAVAAWFDQYVQRPQKGHLAGQNPIEVFAEGKGPGVDRAELTYLMMASARRTVRRNGIHFLGQNYYDPALYGYRKPVTIRYDLQDTSAIYVFDQDNEFMCQARPPEKVHPAAAQIGTEEDRERLREQIALKRRQEKEASVLTRDFLNNEVLPEHRRRLAALGIEETGRPEQPKKRPEKMTAEEKALILAEVKAYEKNAAAEKAKTSSGDDARDDYTPQVVSADEELAARLRSLSEADRYEALSDMEVAGERIPGRWLHFMRNFETGPEYARYRSYFEERRAKLTALYQGSEKSKDHGRRHHKAG